MIENDFSKPIKHSPCRQGDVESANCQAFKIDDLDGLALHLGFLNNTISKVDYFDKYNDSILLIELSDLKEHVASCKQNLVKKIEKAEIKKGKKLTTSELKPLRKKAWSIIVSEFNNKWAGSIAVIERLYRKNNLKDNDPSYQLLIVCKNNTEARILDALTVQLQGMMGHVKVCTTSNVSNFLLTK